MRYSITAVIVNMLSNFALIPVLGIGGLAAATSLGGIVNFYLLLAALPRRVPTIRLAPVWSMFFRSTAASAFMGLGLFLINRSGWFEGLGVHFWERIVRMGLLLVIGAMLYIGVSLPLRNLPRRQRIQ
jgi:peptidoglycan biosynthesis protein MviN/MurJ (putative lipid II flippase)